METGHLTAFDKELTRATLNPKQRADELMRLLEGGRGKPGFEPVFALLAKGELNEVRGHYQGNLREDLEAAFAKRPDDLARLRELRPDGQLGLAAQLTTALRPGSHLLGDRRRAVGLLEGAPAADRKDLHGNASWPALLRAFDTMLPKGESWQGYARLLVENGALELAAKDPKNGPLHADALNKAKTAELLALIRKLTHDWDLKTHSGALVRREAMDQLKAWAERHDAPVREAIWDPVSEALRAEGFREPHLLQLASVLVPAKVAPTSPDATRVAALASRKSEGPAVGEHNLPSLLSHAKTLEEIESLRPEARRSFAELVAGQPIATEQEFGQAAPKISEQFPDRIRGTWSRDLLLPLRPGAPPGPLGRLHHLEDLVYPRRTRQADSNPQAPAREPDLRNQGALVEALAGLRREELAFVRLHGELLARIRASVSEERWKWVQDLLSLSNDPTPQPDDGDPTGRPDAIADPGAAREWHALAVESREEYWVALLEHELAPRSRLGSAVAGVMGPKAVQKEAGWDATEVMSIVQRLWTAAASRRDQPKQEESLPPAARHKRNRHLSPEHFMRRVYERLSEHAKTVLEADKLAPAKEALLEGRPIPAEARLEDAKYDGWKRTARIVGGTRKSDEILLAAEESSGIELLEEWTNVGELRSLRWQAATGAMADGSPPADEHVANANREAANAKLKRFVLQLSPRIHVILDQQKKADEEDLQAKLLRRLALALQRDGLFVAAIDAEQGPLNAEQTRAVILGMASLVAAKATRHGDQLRAVSTKGAQRDIDVANVRRSLGDFLADPSNPDKLAALEEGAEGLDEVTDAFTELKGKVQRYAAAVGVILVSAAMSAASAGALTPALTAATGSAIAALFINSLVATAPAIMVREGLNAGMGGARYNKGAALMRGARDLSMATVTSLAGLVGELGGAASALEGFIGNATAQPLADKLLLISPVEVAMRKVMGLTFDALERGELALDELSIQAFVKDALKDALSKGVTDVGSGAGEGVAGIAQAVAVQTTTGQVDTVGEYDTNPQALAEARVGKLLRWLHPESQQAEPASHHLPNADVTKTPVDELEERGFTLPELRAKLGLPAVLTFCVSLYRETKPLPDGWNFHEAGILATDVLAALDPGDESVLSSFLGWLGYPPEVGAMAAQASKPKTSIGGTGQTP